MKTIKDIKVGDKFFVNSHVPMKLYTIKEIVVNKDGGKPVEDMFGHEVWTKPMYSINASTSDETTCFVVQSDKQNLDTWLTFVKDDDEFKMIAKLINNKKATIEMRCALDDLFDKVNHIKLVYGDSIDDDVWFRYVNKKVEELKNLY